MSFYVGTSNTTIPVLGRYVVSLSSGPRWRSKTMQRIKAAGRVRKASR